MLPWSLPVFTVTCHGRDLPATQGLERRGVDNISVPVWRFGASLLSSHLLSLLFLRRSPWAPPLPAPFLDRHWLIEREGCSLLIGCDSSVLPEVGVPPRAASFHSEITALSRRKKNTGRDYPGSEPEEADEFLRMGEEGSPLCVLCDFSNGNRASIY